jgi:hypothetical protein
VWITWRWSGGCGTVVEFLAAGDECGGLVLGYFFLGLWFLNAELIFVGFSRIFPNL